MEEIFSRNVVSTVTIEKLDEVYEICGSGSSWSVKYDFDESERFLDSL